MNDFEIIELKEQVKGLHETMEALLACIGTDETDDMTCLCCCSEK
jgi:hypothetical protein